MSKFKFLALVVGLAVLVIAAYAGPSFIDQTRLRAWVAPELEHALRQGVTINGAIDVALLPRPMIKARQVHVVRQEQTLADIPEIEARLKLWPLLTGRLVPEALVLSRPEIHLDVLASTQPPAPPPAGAPADPALEPAPHADSPAKAGLGVPRAIGRVVVEKGVLILPDIAGRTIRLTAVDLKLSAEDAQLAISGRFMAGQTGMQVDGDARWLDGQLQTTSLSLRADGGGTLRWTGQGDPFSAEHSLAGRLAMRLGDPVTLLDGGAPAQPLALTADLALKQGGVEAKNIVFSVGDTDFKGEGQFAAGDVPHGSLSLHAVALDLDKLAPSAPAASPVALPPPPALAPQPKQPRKPILLLRQVSLEFSLAVDQLVWRGKVLQDAHLALQAGNGEITLTQATVTLPGNSQVSLVGTVADGPHFDGSFEAKSDDLRQLLAWARIDPSRIPPDRLRAVRLAGQVKGDLDQILIEGVRARIDSSQLDLSAAIKPAPRPAIGVTFAVDSLNGDAYWPQNRPAAAAEPSGAEVAGLAPPPAPEPARDSGIDAEIHGRIGRLAWRGQTANDVALDLTLAPDATIIRSLTAADLGGAHVALSGTLPKGAGLIENGKASLHTHDIARTGRQFGIDLPFQGQADLSADISGPLSSPAIALTAPLLTMGKTWFEHVAVNLSLPPGRLAFDHLTAGLYGGQLTGDATLARDGGASTMHLSLAGAQMKKALVETAEIGLADGDLSGEASFTSSGRGSAELKANLAGDLSLAVKNGTIRGFDLKAANDQLKGGKPSMTGLLTLLSAGVTGGDTSFSSLTGTAKADHGIIVSNDLSLVADGGDTKGTATINLPADTIDAHADFRFANAHDAPALTMRLSGSLESPHRFLDVKLLQQWLSEHGVKTGKPKDVLKGLLKGLTK